MYHTLHTTQERIRKMVKLNISTLVPLQAEIRKILGLPLSVIFSVVKVCCMTVTVSQDSHYNGINLGMIFATDLLLLGSFRIDCKNKSFDSINFCFYITTIQFSEPFS